MELHVYGENLAAAAFSLNAHKNGFIPILMSEKQINTQFSGIEFAHQRVDRGMVFVEPHRPQDLEMDISLYRGQFRSNSLGYIHHVTRWIESLGDLLVDAQVETLFRGQKYSDIFISDQMAALDGLTSQEKKQAKSEIESNLKNKDLIHPKHKNTDSWYAKNRFYQASISTAGETISSQFFKPYLVKMHGQEFQKLIASEHRSSWVPIYYPESVLAWFQGIETNVDGKKFKYPEAGSFAGSLFKMEKYLDQNFEKRPDDFESVWSLCEDVKIQHKRIYFGSSKRLKPIETFRTTLTAGRNVYLRSSENRIYTLFIIDNQFPAFRINQRPMRNGSGSSVCIEFGAASSHLSSDDLIMESKKLCEYLEIDIDPDLSEVVASRYPLRIEQSNSLIKDLEANIELLHRRNYLGYPINELNGSINDQICNALAVNYQLNFESMENNYEPR
jgi:hypothetical protein